MILINDEKKLRVKCEPVLENELDELVAKLEEELILSEQSGRPGVGLAAPQIGIAKDIAIIRYEDKIINLVNSRIEESYDKILFNNEGCLSFPDQQFDTIRFNEVFIRNDFSNDFVATGFLAVVCQHEIDHLNSSLFFDRKLPPNFKRLIASGRVKATDNCPCGSLNPHTKQPNKFKKCCGEMFI